jgi:uncharacterized repeat protein (TIGR01451 family)/PGF-CTERM protein
MNTKIVAFGLVIALVLSAGMVSALSNSGGGDWSYYKEITIKENSGNALSDYQVLVELNPSNFPDNAKSDGSDLRFAEDGKELSYWIEDYDTGAKSAKVWVKVASVPANSEAKIKMYYGNEKASAVSNGDATFEFFDDFAGGLTDWTQFNSPSISFSNGILTITGSQKHFQGIKSNSYFQYSALRVRMKNDGDSAYFRFMENSDYPNTGDIIGLGYSGDNWIHFSTDESTQSYSSIGSPDTNWHVWEERWKSGEGKIYKDGSLLHTKTDYIPNDAIPIRLFIWENSVGRFDWVLVRKYTSPEPTLSLSAEYLTQKLPALSLTKSASPSTIQEGETTTISIRVENTGTGDAKTIEVTDTIPTGFKIISGSKSASFDKIKPGDYRTSEYTLKATGSGKFTCDPATATYEDADGNSYSAVSNPVSIQVGGEVPVGADSDGDGWSDEKEREMGTNPYSVDSDSDGLKDPEDPNPTVPEEKKTPGFEVVFAIAGLLAVAYLAKGRKVK